MTLDPMALDSMTGLGEQADDVPEIDMSEQRMSQVIRDIKRNSRNRRIAMVAPVALAAAVLATLIATPPRYGGLALVPEADATASNNELPRVFGSNGVWRLAEPIAESPAGDPGPAAVVQVPTAPDSPSFVLAPPSADDALSLPVSTSTPPTSKPGQSLDSLDDGAAIDASDPIESAQTAEIDWSSFRAVVRVEPVAEIVADPNSVESDIVESTVADPLNDTESSSESSTESSTPDPSASAEDTSTPEITADAESPPEANPSTSWVDTSDPVVPPLSAVASITQRSVLVYSAHVSVTVQVVDDDSSVIDWCNTRVDWGDGSITGVADPDGVTMCTAPCEYEETPSAVGISTEIEFTHNYTQVIDAAPRIYVATGDGCSYTLAELQLNPFTVVPFS